MTKEQLESIRAREKAETNRTPKHIYHFSEIEGLYAHAHKDIRLLLAEIDRLRGILAQVKEGFDEDKTYHPVNFIYKLVEDFGGTKSPIKAGSEAEK